MQRATSCKNDLTEIREYRSSEGLFYGCCITLERNVLLIAKNRAKGFPRTGKLRIHILGLLLIEGFTRLQQAHLLLFSVSKNTFAL